MNFLLLRQFNTNYWAKTSKSVLKCQYRSQFFIRREESGQFVGDFELMFHFRSQLVRISPLPRAHTPPHIIHNTKIWRITKWARGRTYQTSTNISTQRNFILKAATQGMSSNLSLSKSISLVPGRYWLMIPLMCQEHHSFIVTDSFTPGLCSLDLDVDSHPAKSSTPSTLPISLKLLVKSVWSSFWLSDIMEWNGQQASCSVQEMNT